MKYLLLSIGISLSFFGLTACKKDKVQAPPSMESLITGSPWKLVAASLEENGVLKNTSFNTYKECTKDNDYVFFKDQSVHITEGKTKCSSTDPARVNYGQWTLQNNDKSIRFTWNAASPIDYEIVKLTSDSMLLMTVSGARVTKNAYAH